MSSTKHTRANELLSWLNENAYWNDSLIVKPANYGLGVFLNTESSVKVNDILLRIPKSNILAPKNSFIYNLLVDYGPINPSVDLQSGMHSLILTFIYEMSIGKSSPWYKYLMSIDFTFDDSNGIPICLWDEKDKKNLKNTEIDLLNMLNFDELIEFYIECINFARANSDLVSIPQILIIPNEILSVTQVLKGYRKQLTEFSRIVQIVISRAFLIDEFFNLSLVPGADLFNHIGPSFVDGEINGNENVHFICDSNACGVCGDVDCDDHDDMDLESDLEEEEWETGNGNMGEAVVKDIESEGENDVHIEDESLICNDSDDESCDESNETDDENDDVSHQSSNKARNHHCNEDHCCDEGGHHEVALTPIKEITLDYIKQMETELSNDSESDTIYDDEEVSTLSLSEDEDQDEKDQEEHNEALQLNQSDDELTQELLDNSKCCDIILISKPNREHNFEIFNSYGNNLSNTYLLQRYGFISKQNPNSSVLLSVQFFKYLKNYKQGLSKTRCSQVDEKLRWLKEVGFELINELLANDQVQEDQDSEPSWELSMRVLYNGTISTHTYLILNLIKLPFKFFKLLIVNNERRLIKRLNKFIFSYNEDDFNNVIKQWCIDKLNSYPALQSSKNFETISQLVNQEKETLNKFINGN